MANDGVDGPGPNATPTNCSGCGKIGYIVGPYAELPRFWRVMPNNSPRYEGEMGEFCTECQDKRRKPDEPAPFRDTDTLDMFGG